MNSSGTLQNIRVLYADDVAANRRYLKALLEKLGLQADVAEDGSSALKAWESTRHPLVLLDVHMPDLDGAEVARRIRLLQAVAEDVIILGITADMREGLRESLQMAGMDDCMEKPTDTQALVDALEPWIGASTESSNAQDKHRSILYDDEELLALLLQELPSDMNKLKAAFDSGDLVSARQIAHQLSGVAALYCMTRLRGQIVNLEEHLRIGAPMTDELLLPVTEALTEDLVEIQTAQMT